MSSHFEFHPERALAVTAYLADKTGETMYTILKMIYVVDRIHLERYGRPITGDRFVAMTQGAVPSKIYDSMKFLRGEKAKRNWLPNAQNFLMVEPETHDVSVLKKPPLDALSETDVECLDAGIAILKRWGRWHVRNLAHDKAWKATAKNRPIDLIKIAESLEDGPTIARHLSDRFPGTA